MGKRKWEAPKLIVLLRGRPEEAVLAMCRNTGIIPASALNTSKDGCKDKITGTCTAVNCINLVGS